jgi:hemerythrin-like domain-containing protein
LNALLTLHRSPSAGFDQPFEMLAACHERVERMLCLLERLAQHLPAHGADEQAQAAARDLIRYFDQAAPQHHQDEELHVLPALRQAGHGALAERLHAEHMQMAQAWKTMREGLAAVGRGTLALGGADLADQTSGFAALYRAHVATEDTEAYPLVASSADATVQALMGAEMAARRGLR